MTPYNKKREKRKKKKKERKPDRVGTGWCSTISKSKRKRKGWSVDGTQDSETINQK